MTSEHPTSDGEGGGASGASVDRVERELAGILSDPGTWMELDPGVEDRIVEAIAAEAAGAAGVAGAAGAPAGSGPGGGSMAPVVSIDAGRDRAATARRWIGPIVAGVAAALVVLVGFAALTRETGGSDVEVAMAGTDLAPDARADLAIDATPNGTRLILDVSGLPPAPEGKVYEAWLRKDQDVGVSAGTFHMRGGDGDLELWAGVSIEDYPLVTVTLQDEADPVSSGQVVLRALVP